MAKKPAPRRSRPAPAKKTAAPRSTARGPKTKRVGPSRSASGGGLDTKPGAVAPAVASRFWWEASRRLPAFDALGTPALRKAARGPTKRPAKHFAVVIHSSPKKPVSEACAATMRDFEAREGEICEAVLTAIHRHYTRLRATLKGLVSAREFAAMAPPARSVVDMSPLIAFSTLNVHPSDALGSDLGFHFECAWEEEHGLGVRVRGGRVVLVAEESDASGDWASAQSTIREMGNGFDG